MFYIESRWLHKLLCINFVSLGHICCNANMMKTERQLIDNLNRTFL